MTPGLVIAGTQSGCGKTTIALGLMAVLAKRGYRVQGFKTGPDYIDPTFYKAVTGREGENLDIWMVGREQVGRIYQEGALGANFVVEAGSTAEIARVLDLPVIMVGALDVEVEMSEKRTALGYREVAALADNILLKRGQIARGHEFHYSKIIKSNEVENAFLTMQNQTLGFQKGNLIASYVYLHFGSNVTMGERLARKCGKE